MSGPVAATSTPGGADGALARAHAALMSHSDLQFDFTLFNPPKPPGWLAALGRFLVAAGPVFKWLFWIGLALGVGMILYFLGRELLLTRFPSLRRKRKAAAAPEWRPEAERARTLLEDADRLAAQGRYGEAVRLILFRSIEDIDERWPGQVRPALTSRDIGELAVLPASARVTFASIAQVVEKSLFGGRMVDAAQFDSCRGAYAAFALPDHA